MGKLKFLIYILCIFMISCDLDNKDNNRTTTSPASPTSPTSSETSIDCQNLDKNACSAQKTCRWDQKSNVCIKLGGPSLVFPNEDAVFESSLKDKVDAFGTDHGEHPDWGLLCGFQEAPPSGGNQSGPGFKNAIKAISIVFKKDDKNLTVNFTCNKNIAKSTSTSASIDNPETVKTYAFIFKANETTDGAFLLELEDSPSPIISSLSKDQLHFFTKAKWIYSLKDKSIKMASLLADTGFGWGTLNKSTKIETEKEMDEALANAKKGSGYYLSADDKDIGAVSVVFSKK